MATDLERVLSKRVSSVIMKEEGNRLIISALCDQTDED
jgi:hypothetical protein